MKVSTIRFLIFFNVVCIKQNLTSYVPNFSFPSFLIDCLFLKLIFRYSLYTVDTNLLSDIGVANIFSSLWLTILFYPHYLKIIGYSGIFYFTLNSIIFRLPLLLFRHLPSINFQVIFFSFSLGCFYIFSLSLVFCSFLLQCLDMNFFSFIVVFCIWFHLLISSDTPIRQVLDFLTLSFAISEFFYISHLLSLVTNTDCRSKHQNSSHIRLHIYNYNSKSSSVRIVLYITLLFISKKDMFLIFKDPSGTKRGLKSQQILDRTYSLRHYRSHFQ